MGNTLIHWDIFADAIGMRRFQYFDALFLFESSSFQTINESISKSCYITLSYPYPLLTFVRFLYNAIISFDGKSIEHYKQEFTTKRH